MADQPSESAFGKSMAFLTGKGQDMLEYLLETVSLVGEKAIDLCKGALGAIGVGLGNVAHGTEGGVRMEPGMEHYSFAPPPNNAPEITPSKMPSMEELTQSLPGNVRELAAGAVNFISGSVRDTVASMENALPEQLMQFNPTYVAAVPPPISQDVSRTA